MWSGAVYYGGIDSSLKILRASLGAAIVVSFPTACTNDKSPSNGRDETIISVEEREVFLPRALTIGLPHVAEKGFFTLRRTRKIFTQLGSSVDLRR